MKKTFYSLTLGVSFLAAVFFTACNNQSSTNTEATTADSTQVESVATDSTIMPAPTVSEWYVTIVVKDKFSGSPLVGVTTRLKAMAGDTSCRFDSTILTDSTGTARYSGTGSCPCTKFRAGVQTTGCTKQQDNVHCGDVVNFTCP